MITTAINYAIENPLSSFIAFAAVVAAAVGLARNFNDIYQWITRGRREGPPYKLQYSRLDAVLDYAATVPHSIVGAQITANLDNPNKFPIRIRIVTMHTTLGDRTCPSRSGREISIDIGAHARDVVVNAGHIVTKVPPGHQISGALDWVIEYGRIRKDGVARLRYKMRIIGDCQLIHYPNHLAELRWVPHKDGETLTVIPADILEVVDENELRLKPSGLPTTTTPMKPAPKA